MQLPERKLAEQFIDHAFIKKSIVHFTKCQARDIAHNGRILNLDKNNGFKMVNFSFKNKVKGVVVESITPYF